MKDIVLFLLLAIVGFMIWNSKRFSMSETFTDVSSSTPVSPGTIQTIINSIQEKNPDVYPVQTIYINPMMGDHGTGMYNARIMFINTRGYFGVQYDVQADSNGNIISMDEQPMPGIGAADVFKPFSGKDMYRPFEDTQVALDQQFADLKKQVPGFQTKLDTWLSQMRDVNRDNANIAAMNGTIIPSVANSVPTEKAIAS